MDHKVLESISQVYWSLEPFILPLYLLITLVETVDIDMKSVYPIKTLGNIVS